MALDGWIGGWMVQPCSFSEQKSTALGGWMDGWIVKAGLRIAYSNQKRGFPTFNKAKQNILLSSFATILLTFLLGSAKPFFRTSSRQAIVRDLM